MTTSRVHPNALRQVRAMSLGIALGLALGTPVQANVDISSVPLFLTASVDPNLMFILDDSGSMHFEIMPDDYTYWGNNNGSVVYVYPRASNVYGPSDYNNRVVTVDANVAYNALARSPQVNTLYYNPSVTYTPWARYDGSLYPAASTTCALHNPERSGTTAAYCRDLTANNGNYNSNRWNTCNSSGTCSSTTTSKTYWPATYYWHNGGSTWTWGNYTPVEIRDTTTTYSGHGRENRTDCATPGTCTYAEEIQNFANWYTYYRSRILAARAGIGRAFSEQGEGMRLGFGAINKGSSGIDGVNTGTIISGVRQFAGANRQNFFTSLYTHPIPAEGTPLRRALDDAGNYFSRPDNAGPWGADPGANNGSAHLQCRQNFTILMTDGYWTEGTDYQASTSGARGNNDGTGGPTITGPNSQSYTYSAVRPFTDTYSNTLADVAMYYWKRDLRTDLVNEVPTTPANPAFWQHMVTFGVGLGVTGSVSPADAFNAIVPGNNIPWPNPTSSEAAKLDDLLHASVNSRGGFFSAADPNMFATELSNVLSMIIARVESSSTSAAASSATLQSDTLLYTAGFRSTDWSGQLLARHINRGTNGALTLGGTAWSAENQLRTQAANGTRNIFTSSRDSISGSAQIITGGGVSLAGTLSTNQRAALNRNLDGITDNLADNRIAWMYGSETADSSFRSRSLSGESRLLGDIINSNPQFAGKRDFGYRRLTDLGQSYVTYRTSSAYQSRPDMLYVGANDGMLHAFDARTGQERFAYLPSELLLPELSGSFARINRLISSDYEHRYFVDGTPMVADAHWGGSWKTVLVGTMGAGGRTVFALDVTNPSSFSTGNVLWEFTDPDLGYGVGKPLIVRMSNGVWAAVFGNGYNSANHKTVLYIVRLSDGQLLAKINTNSSADTSSSPNGLASPNAALSMDTLSASTIYAGDLKGQLWRFDVSGNQSTWTNNSRRKVLFSAVDANGTPQPITSAPEIALNPGNPSTLVVTFGTGSYFRTQDSSTSQIQTLYGIFDNNGAVVNGRNQLTRQEITWQGGLSADGADYILRAVSDNPIGSSQGWYLDLVYGSPNGERVISKPVLLSGAVRDRVRFTTMIPDPDPCGTTGGRRGFLMDIMIGTGGRTATPVFDLNNDGEFNQDDIPDSCTDSCSGRGFGSGEEMIVIQDEERPLEHICSGDGECEETRVQDTPDGRQSWRQLR